MSAPSDGPAPADGSTPGGGPASTDGLAPGDRAAPGDRQAPTDRSAPSDRPTPTDSLEPSGRVLLAGVTEETVDVARCAALVETAQDGAVVTFAGVVRDHDDGRGVSALSYSAHPSAADVAVEVGEEIARRHSDVRLAFAHRTGDLAVGDVALAAAVASAHRAAAFAACADLVDLVKERLPIWKEQSFDDGTTEWVASLG